MANVIIDSIKAQIEQKIQLLKNHPAMMDVLNLHIALNKVEEVEGIELTSLAEMFGLQSATTEERRVQITPGMWYGKTPLDAAKDFLARKGKAATLDEIADALRSGGCDVGVRKDFGVSLARSTFNFAKVGDDHFGLLDWYPEEKTKRFSGAAKRKGSSSADVAPEQVQQEAAGK